jgi:hypothetical protein
MLQNDCATVATRLARAASTACQPARASAALRGALASLAGLVLLIAGFPAHALTLNPASVTMTQGSTVSVQLSRTHGEIQAESSNTAVVTVSLANVTRRGATLRLVAVGPGATTVLVRDARTSNVSLPVTVTAPMSVSPTSLSLAAGTTGTLTVSNPSGTLSASSSNLSIATVSISGNVVTVKGVAAGGATVAVKDSHTTINVPVTVTSATTSNWVYKILAANDLGMHCVDADFSVFSILPPFNVVNAQVVRRGSTGTPSVVSDATVSLRYEAARDSAGSLNSTSLGSSLGPKTNFWTYAASLYGAGLSPGEGLTGLYMPKDAPSLAAHSLPWNSPLGLFKAEGVPIIPTDDSGATNRYPLMRLVATEKATGKDVATLDVVLPVSEETTCSDCHLTGGIASARTGVTWSSSANPEVQSRENILRLHDSVNGTQLAASKPVLCAGCHYSTALDLGGLGPQGAQVGKPTMSAAMHAYHANKMVSSSGVVYSDTWVPLGGTPDPQTQSCYTCHPGKNTRCLRGAMTETVSCQNCHGGMKAVGGLTALKTGGSIDGTNDGKPRRPWVDLPRCQSCHTGDAVNHLALDPSTASADGLRALLAFAPSDASASPRLAGNNRFAENTGKLYRFSKGHSGVACEGCHGSTHAIWANPVDAHNDNVAAKELQGHAGTITECATCHASGSLALTLNGPHGMHNVGDSRWTRGHESLARSNLQACAACHGTDYRGTVLSRTAAARTWSTEHGTRTVAKGQIVSCYDCHNGPGGGG